MQPFGHLLIKATTCVFIVGLLSCKKGGSDATIFGSNADSIRYNADWTFASHGNADQNYEQVFPQNAVNTLEIRMAANQWSSIRANMKTLYGSDFGSGIQGPPPGTSSGSEPDYVDVMLSFNGKSWKNVGFRLKGNSSLRSAWSQGIFKLPFRLNFDEFEDKYPAITDQHFFGFEELSFSPAFKDQSLIREKLASDVFRMAGIPSAQTAFYKVFIDFGEGLKYCGVYTGVELPDDNMIKAQFGEEKGNIYKPESSLTSFVQSLFEKKNNETAADYSDVRSLITILGSSSRASDAAQWRAQLEGVFNTDHFLKYLAVNNAIVNWDSYGVMAHNYYLYNHTLGKLTWIPWDHNESFQGSPGITGSTSSGGGSRSALSLSMNEVTSGWPLIRYIADDPVYLLKYKTYLKYFRDSFFTEAVLFAMIDRYKNLVYPYAIGANGEQPKYTYLLSESAFQNEFTLLKSHITARRALIATFVP